MNLEYDHEFIAKIDLALEEIYSIISRAKKDEIKWVQEDAENVEMIFQSLRSKVIENTLPISNGAGLGITRALGEWAPESLYKAGRDVEWYFMNKWKK